ncbi:MAG: Acidobacterial duplicated orphan permease (function unknown), partial [uncultured Solirubrobacteraceae bacterium]
DHPAVPGRAAPLPPARGRAGRGRRRRRRAGVPRRHAHRGARPRRRPARRGTTRGHAPLRRPRGRPRALLRHLHPPRGHRASHRTLEHPGAGSPLRRAQRRARPRLLAHRRRDAGPRHRRHDSDVQRRAWRTAAPAPLPRGRAGGAPLALQPGRRRGARRGQPDRAPRLGARPALLLGHRRLPRPRQRDGVRRGRRGADVRQDRLRLRRLLPGRGDPGRRRPHPRRERARRRRQPGRRRQPRLLGAPARRRPERRRAADPTRREAVHAGRRHAARLRLPCPRHRRLDPAERPRPGRRGRGTRGALAGDDRPPPARGVGRAGAAGGRSEERR